ncbi:DUF294 nucleotidyltransferase-like domain-containing protein [Rhizobium halophytocola]|uniref:CBS domain-containing protein n=1 Tax=Rhizobium halophytocola TaxID=735519 RepID=A0ABS4DTT0_9HYPH|nr:DUF294 nucleotidyltransferase-like domain-containing protein [Rhizobium halophytocola]MBP1849104.1 CBS domain-containing protein [Rhizobium halophytocola]
MTQSQADIVRFLETVHPYDSLPPDALAHAATCFEPKQVDAGGDVYRLGEPLEGLFLIMEGSVEVRDAVGGLISQLSPRNSLGERGLLRDGLAATHARALSDCRLLVLPTPEFQRLMDEQPVYRRFFTRGHTSDTRRSDMASHKVGDLMSRPPVVIAPDESVCVAARLMRDRHVSSLGVVEDDRFIGILTTGDLTARVLAEARVARETTVRAVMTPDPTALVPEALGSDVLHLMLERQIGHLPVVEAGRLVGMVTQTDLTRFQAMSSAVLVRDVATAGNAEALAMVTARIPQLLAQLIGANHPHQVVTRLITDIADAVTRRLVVLGEETFGPPPVPYAWLACGSQGRQEQTGVSDQDNCIVIDDRMQPDDISWYARLARFVSDGLDACGYVYCPGDMMATNPRWCQPLSVWRRYFEGWIRQPDPMAQMLASVMFDLRPIAGDEALFRGLQARTLEEAGQNSIFVAHMISNSLKHAPPLGLLRGFATIRSGEHRNQIDMKHNGVVPVVDLGRVYALRGGLVPVNTRQRLQAARDAGVISGAGAQDLIAAYDLVAEMRIRNQARQIRAGEPPGNFLAPYDFGDFERSHLRDAFVVIRTMQSALGHGRSAPI